MTLSQTEIQKIVAHAREALLRAHEARLSTQDYIAALQDRTMRSERERNRAASSLMEKIKRTVQKMDVATLQFLKDSAE